MKIAGSSVLATGSRKQLPYVVVKHLRKKPKTGAYVYVTPGRRDPRGFGGVVIGTGTRKGRTVIVAVAPLPTAAQVNRAMKLASTAAGGGSLVDLLPKRVGDWLGQNLGELECGSGIGEWPVKVTGFGLDPLRFDLSGPTFDGSNEGSFGLSSRVTPSMTLTLGLKQKFSCTVKPKALIDVEFPPPPAFFFAGPVPYSIRTSLQLSAEGAVDGSASGQVVVGTTLAGGIAGDGVGLRWSPAPSATPFATVSKRFAVNAQGSVSANVSAVARLLFARLWGPKVTLSFGWKLQLTGLNTGAGGRCAEVSFPLKLGVALGFNPGYAWATGPIGDKLSKLAEQFNSQLEQVTLAHIIKIITPGHTAIDVSVQDKNLWRLTKAFDTPDFLDFTAPIRTFPLAQGNSNFGSCAQLMVKGLDPNLQCSKIADGCVHAPPAAPICGVPSSWSQFSVSAKGLVPGATYDLTLGGKAHGVVEDRPIGPITADQSGDVAGVVFTLPYMPAHDPWTLTATPRDGSQPLTTTLETGLVDCVVMQAGGGAFSSQVAAVGLAPNSAFKEVVDGTTAQTLQADANGTVPTTEIDGSCQPGQVQVMLSGSWIDHGPFTDDATKNVNQFC